MNIEDLKAKAGSEHRVRIAALDADYKQKREALEQEYEARCKVLEALNGVSTEQVAQVLRWAGVGDEPKLRQSTTPGGSGTLASTRLPYGYQTNKTRELVGAIHTGEDFRVADLIRCDALLTLGGVGKALEVLVTEGICTITHKEPNPAGGPERNVYKKL